MSSKRHNSVADLLGDVSKSPDGEIRYASKLEKGDPINRENLISTEFQIAGENVTKEKEAPAMRGKLNLPIEHNGSVLISGPLVKRGWDGLTQQLRHFELTDTELRYRKLGESTEKIVSLGLVASVSIEKLQFPSKGRELCIHVASFSNAGGSGRLKSTVELHRHGQHTFPVQLLSAEKEPIRLRISKAECSENETHSLRDWERSIRRAVRNFWGSVLCSGFLTKWSAAKRQWERRFFYLTENNLHVMHGNGFSALKMSQIPHWNPNRGATIDDHVRIMRVVALDHVRDTSELARAWDSRRDSGELSNGNRLGVGEGSSSSLRNLFGKMKTLGRTTAKSSARSDAHDDASRGVLSVHYVLRRAISSTRIQSTDRETLENDAPKRVRTLHLAGDPIALGTLKESLQWALKKISSGAPSEISSSRAANARSRPDVRESRSLKTFSRSELEDLLLATRGAVSRLQKENRVMRARLKDTESSLSESKLRVDTLTKMLIGTTVKSKLGQWRGHVREVVTKRERVIREWFESERLFASSMQFAADRYYVPLRKCAEDAFDRGISTSDPDSPVDVAMLKHIFGNIEAISRCAEDGVSALELALGTLERSGASTKSPAPNLQSYHLSPRQLDLFLSTVLIHLRVETGALKVFLENYMMHCTSAIAVARNIAHFKSFCDEQEKDPSCGGLGLESLLVMPVQRLPRRRMLLKDLMRATDRSHPSYVKMQVALRDLGKAIADCDDHLNVAKLLQIEELTQGKHSSRHRLSSNEEDDDSGEDEGRRGVALRKDSSTTERSNLPTIIVPNRRFCQEGALKKWCARTHWQSRYVYVFSDCLMYGKCLGDPIRAQCNFDCARVEAVGHNCFQLQFFKHKRSSKNSSDMSEEHEIKTTRWKADTKLERDQWVGVLSEQISMSNAKP
eukprot:g1117.t1